MHRDTIARFFRGSTVFLAYSFLFACVLEQPRDECKKSPKAEDLSDTCMGDAYEPPSFTIIANLLLTSNFLFFCFPV